MKKTNKRILALLLTVTALLGLMVPAVSAEETAAEELKAVSYDFDTETVFDAIAKNENPITPTGTTSGSRIYYYFNNNSFPAAISDAYSIGNLNWEFGVNNGAYLDKNTSYFLKGGFDGLRVCLANDANATPTNTRVGRWVAFPITAPAAGTYNFEIKHGIRNEGIDEVGFYIISYTNAMTQAEVQSLINDCVAGNTVDSITKVGTYSCIGASSTEDVETDSLSGSYTFNSNDKYMIVLRADASDKTSDKYIYVSNITMTPSVAQVGDTGYTTVQAAADAAYASETDKTVTLLQSATEDSVEVKAGVTLDLNGKALTANVTGSGTVTDSSDNSQGKIVGVSAVQNVGENEIALYDGATTRIVGYTLTPNGTSSASDYEVVEENGEVSAVKFWYTFTFDNDEAYKMIVAAKDSEDYANAKFAVGAELSFNNGTPKSADLKNATVVSDWAAAMANNTENKAYAFYVSVTGFDSLASDVSGTLGVKLTVNGSAGSAESAVINYTIG